MSKIFEALRKVDGEMTDLMLPMVTPKGAEAADQALIEEILRETATATPELVAHVTDAFAPAAGAAAAPDTESNSAVKAAPMERNIPQRPGIRTVPLRLSKTSPALPFDGSNSRAGEQYRVARTKIIQHPMQPHVLVVSSAGPGDGKTITSINLAGALALKSEAEILLVDADLRRSSIAALLGIEKSPGLADVLAGSCALEDAIVRLDQFPNLCVLPSGKALANPTELLDSGAWAETCGTLRRQFKFVIFDAPPIGAVADYELIEASCDGVILVVRPDHTNRTRCLEAIGSVPKERLIGVLMNCVSDWFLWKTRDYYYYGAEK